jgi:hypothetical protein
MPELIKMPSIGQYNTVVKDIQHQARYTGQDENDEPIFDRNAKLPTVTFKGTVKLHGTNASVCYDVENLWAQSKGNVITPEKDNAGFAMFVETNKEHFLKELKAMYDSFDLEKVCVYGEWDGKGIQKGVAISEIEKTFFAFAIKFLKKGEEDMRWAQNPEVVLEHLSDGNRIRSIFEFETYEIDVDIENPKEVQNKLIDITEKVEAECPVGKAMGVSGIGEGVVWVGWFNDTKHNFKVKGEKHANSKVKKLKTVDEAKEKAKIEFANYATPAWRLEQMYQETFDTLNGGQGDIKRTGEFLKAVVADVMKEELEKMGEAGLEPKEVNGMISKIARKWFMEQLDREILG